MHQEREQETRNEMARKKVREEKVDSASRMGEGERLMKSVLRHAQQARPARYARRFRAGAVGLRALCLRGPVRVGAFARRLRSGGRGLGPGKR